MPLWAESFKRAYLNVSVQIQAAGSSTAPPALAENTSNLGSMSRLMKDKDVESFEKKFDYTTSSVRAIPLSREAGKDFVSAKPENAITGTYPLARFLYVYALLSR